MRLFWDVSFNFQACANQLAVHAMAKFAQYIWRCKMLKEFLIGFFHLGTLIRTVFSVILNDFVHKY